MHELIKRARAGIEKQDALAYCPDASQCRLRTPSGLACAVGQIILDEFYSEELETEADPGYRNNYDIRDAIIQSNPDLDLSDFDWTSLSELQRQHDDATTVEDFLRDTT